MGTILVAAIDPPKSDRPVWQEPAKFGPSQCTWVPRLRHSLPQWSRSKTSPRPHGTPCDPRSIKRLADASHDGPSARAIPKINEVSIHIADCHPWLHPTCLCPSNPERYRSIGPPSSPSRPQITGSCNQAANASGRRAAAAKATDPP